MIKLQSYILFPEYQINTYLLWDSQSKEAILIDPGAPSHALVKYIKEQQLLVKMIVNTHGHGDHIGGNAFFAQELGCPIAIHPLDAPMLMDNRKNMSEYMGTPLPLKAAELLLNEGDEVLLGNTPVRIIHTPGHTPGGICLLAGKYLISGDTLFEQSIGRTDFPGGNHASLIKCIKEKLFVLPDDVLVYPGHGPSTSIGLEKANNPFVR